MQNIPEYVTILPDTDFSVVWLFLKSGKALDNCDRGGMDEKEDKQAGVSHAVHAICHIYDVWPGYAASSAAKAGGG